MLLDIRGLRVSFRTYGGSVKAVRGVDLSIEQGESLAVVGESGCGKSVTAQAIMRLLPPQAEITGSIVVDGTDLLTLPEKKMKNIRGGSVGMIFQDPMTSLDPTMQIGKQIMEGLRIHDRNMKRREAETRVVEMLGTVGIPRPEAQFRRYAYELSGGMRQRVVIAMAIVCRPRLLIADEPTTALDVTTQAQILDLIRSLKATLKTSVMLITHDMGVVANMADKIAVFYAGQIVEEGAADDVFGNPSHPYTSALMAFRPRLDRDRSQKLAAIGGAPPDLFAPPEGCVFFDRCGVPMEICRDNPPPFFETGDRGHRSLCWLHHKFGAARKDEWKTRMRAVRR